MIRLVVVKQVKPEFESTIMEAAAPLVEASRREAGNVSYEFVRDVANPGVFLFLEQWESADALARHGQTEHFKTICPKLDAMCVGSVLHRIEE